MAAGARTGNPRRGPWIAVRDPSSWGPAPPWTRTAELPALLGFEPGPALAGELRPPGSKSIAQRLLIAASLAHEEFRITALPDGADVQQALGVARACAHELVTLAPAAVSVRGSPPGPERGWSPSQPLALGESGTLARLTLAALGLCGRAGRWYELAPAGSLARRSSPALVAALRAAGVGIEARGGGDALATLALRVRPLGPPSELELGRPGSSQEVSALLIALAAWPDAITLRVQGSIPSRPYLDLTLGVLARLGVALEESSDERGAVFHVRGPLRAPPAPWAVEADASGGAVALCAACISGGGLRVNGIGRDSPQGDARIVEHLARFGCAAGAEASSLWARGAPTHGAELDLAGEPDLAPVLAAVAAAVALSGPGARHASRLTGLETLPGKESSRIEVLASGLAALGLRVEADAASLSIAPGAARPPASLELDPHGDHRMAFAFALLGLAHSGVLVRDPTCVRKSWPRFWTDLAALGARLHTRPS
jgi:3-phosphoshikimate 1-carboxyvinyltransferase